MTEPATAADPTCTKKLKKAPSSRARWWLIRGMALTSSFVFALILFEIGLRVFKPIPLRIRGDRLFLYRNTKLEIPRPPDRPDAPEIIHTKNMLGFRGPNPPFDFDQSLTVITVGGSTTECYFISDDDTWPRQMAERLKTDFPNLWLNNAGLDGHSTYGHGALIHQYLSELKPDFIIFLIGINEVGRKTDPSRYDKGLHRPTGADHSRFRDYLTTAANYSHACALLDVALRFREAKNMNLVEEKVSPPVTPDFGDAPRDLPDAQLQAISAEHREVADTYFKYRLQMLLKLCADHSIRPILVTQPALYGSGIDRGTGIDLARISVGSGNGASEWRKLEIYNDVTRQVATEKNVPLVDLAQLMPKDSRYFYDFIHYNTAGCVKVAELLAPKISEILAKSRTSQ